MSKEEAGQGRAVQGQAGILLFLRERERELDRSQQRISHLFSEWPATAAPLPLLARSNDIAKAHMEQQLGTVPHIFLL